VAPERRMNTADLAALRAWWIRPSVYHRRVIRLSQTPMPKHTTYKLLLVLSIAMVTGGCGILYKQPIYQGNLLEKANVDQLQTGMSKQQVTLLLGTPSVEDPFHHDRWDYTSTQRTDRVGRTEKKNLTVWFENDSVVKWEGDYFPEQDEQLAKQTVKQFGRNLPKEKKKGGR
jgi:outer membrane protein assembly factor BamE